MFSLVFMGKESEHLQKQHIHESPKIMLIPAAILAALCIVWGLAEPLVGSFMHVETEGLLAAFTSLEFPIFIALIIPVGILAYYTYYKGFNAIRNVAGTKNPISTTLKHAYFVDDFYNAISKGLTKISAGLTRFENAVFGKYVDEFGTKVGDAAQPGKALELKQDPSSNYRNYLAAAVIGFILIVILIILTMGVV
jgi:NADH:ubiquinone oxidoreductase subunit 5 (subunit L)/multisubunit Na+/H+ antiporter MnhA subunit